MFFINEGHQRTSRQRHQWLSRQAICAHTFYRLISWTCLQTGSDVGDRKQHTSDKTAQKSGSYLNPLLSGHFVFLAVLVLLALWSHCVVFLCTVLLLYLERPWKLWSWQCSINCSQAPCHFKCPTTASYSGLIKARKLRVTTSLWALLTRCPLRGRCTDQRLQL